jgi:predicted lipid-binding transport protein (Tim44 family)
MKIPVSPKVTASGLAAIIAGLFLANLDLITPDLFSGLGKWSGLVYALTIAIVTTVAGWLKSDPLRTAGLAAQAADNAQPAPDAAVVNAPATVAEPAAPAVVPTAPAALSGGFASKLAAITDAAPAEPVPAVAIPAPAEAAPVAPAA